MPSENLNEPLIYSYADIHKTVARLADRIKNSTFKPDFIVAIGSGGFIPARIMRTYLHLTIYTVGLALYTEDKKTLASPKKIQWIDEIEKKISGKKVLLVDEVDDSRITLEYCIHELQRYKPAGIGVAVLHNKIKPKRGVIPAYVELYVAGEELPDRWVAYPWDAIDIDEHEAMTR